MQVGWNINTIVSVSGSVMSLLGIRLVLRVNVRQYGSLYILSAVIGTILCIIFVAFGFYTFSFRLFKFISQIPLTLLLTMFPFYVLFGVRYSPKTWGWKIPFYWTLVHIGVFSEAMIE